MMNIPYDYPVGMESDGMMQQPSFMDNCWVEHSCWSEVDADEICALQYDEAFELLWSGSASGRVTSFIPSSPYESYQKYSSFRVAESPVLDILPCYRNILSVTSDVLRMHTIGGAPLLNYNKPTTGSDSFQFTSASYLRDYTQEQCPPVNVLAGTSTNILSVFDLSYGQPVGLFNVETASVKVKSNNTYVATAGNDGRVRLLDGGLRTQHIIHTLTAHTGSILDVALQTDGYYLITCGMSGRALNPYDPKSPIIVSIALCTNFDIVMKFAFSTAQIPLFKYSI
jgi:WD40 repeat protein